MDRITLEILSAYLPWGIEVEFTYYGKQPKIYRLDHLILTEWLTSKGSIKPLLHSLSIQFLTSIIHHADDMEEVLTAIEDDTLLQIRHDLFMEIVEHHGDIFGLIPLGLAVDKRREAR